MSDKKEKKPKEKWLKLKQELEKERRLAAEYKEHLQRLAADFENYRKRIEKEREDFVKFSKEDLIYEFLTVLDNFEMALHHVKNTTRPEKIIEGIELIEKQVKGILKKEGLEIIEATGKRFDPYVHEAIIHEEHDRHPEGFIIEELRKGYILGGKVIRPAQVKIATAKAAKGKDTVNSKLKTQNSK